MNDLSKKVLELASEDREFYESLTKAPDLEAAAALLKGKGVEASVEELEAALRPEDAAELSDDELEAVAGGKGCGCFMGGGGEASGEKDAVCACVALGYGQDTTPKFPKLRCLCSAVGGGKSFN